LILKSVGIWSSRVHENTADTISILVDGHSDVTLLTPVSAPRVSDDEVLFARLVTISDSSNGVIEVSAALGGVQDTAGVHLEVGVGSINGDASWLLSNGSLELGDLLLWNSLVGLNSNDFLGFDSLALFASFGFVWVVSLELKWVGLGIFEGPDFETTIAALVSGGAGAIDELLLGKLQELALVDEVRSLHGGNGGEGPAGTALSLVLDSVDGTLGSPVDLSIKDFGVELLNLSVVHGGWLSGEDLLVLLMGPGGEFVVTENVRVLLSVDLVNFFVLDGELLKSEFVLLIGSIADTKSRNMLHVSLFDHGEVFRLLLTDDSSEGGSFANDVHFKF